MIASLDTQVLVWLVSGKHKRLTKDARHVIAKASLLLSPMVLMELEMLYEIRRSTISAQAKLQARSASGFALCLISTWFARQ